MASDHELGQSVFLRNLRLVPVLVNGNGSGDITVATVAEALGPGTSRFTELETPTVNEISFENGGDLPVLMIDGEEITGAMQNRIVSRSTLAAARSTTSVPVICAEQGRWSELGRFQTGFYSYPRIRSILAEHGEDVDTSQHEVWSEISRKITITSTRSRTSSMHDVYATLQDDVDRYLEGFISLNHDTVGVIGAAGGRILGCDIFANPALYRRFERNLIQSYALDAIEYQRRGSDDKAEDFWQALCAHLNRAPARPRQTHRLIRVSGIAGQVLAHQGRLLHLSAFPTA